MSAHTDTHGDAGQATHGHGDHAHDSDGHEHHAPAHGTMKDYLTGFGLSVVLTAIPFWIVWGDVFKSPVTAAVVVMVFAVAQIFVHMVFFLHMNPRAEGGWNMLAAIFTIVVVVITLAGSMWIMSHLHYNMAPMQKGQHTMETPGQTPAPAKPTPE